MFSDDFTFTHLFGSQQARAVQEREWQRRNLESLKAAEAESRREAVADHSKAPARRHLSLVGPKRAGARASH
jgi:hypothetical protein